MDRLWACVGIVLLLGSVASASVDVTFTRDGGQLLEDVGLAEFHTHNIELWLTNTATETTALSAYQFDFEGGDFATGMLDATSWLESSAFDGLDPPWMPVDQVLDTVAADWTVEGVTGSLSTPFVGPALPLATPVLIGTFDVYVDAPEGDLVDVLLSADSGIDDQNGNLPAIVAFGVEDVLVVPEPGSLALLLAIGLVSIRFRR